jgi:hypothetical protein
VRRSYFAFATFALLSISPAFGQYVTVIEACSRDVTNSCAPAQLGRSSLMECVNAHFQDFTEPCKAALVKLAAVRESCGADIHEQCPAIKPSAGRILLCIKRHFTSLSEPCKEAIGRAAERKVGAR